jgi:magnesium-transporting ATPase (P-type)
VSAAPATTGLGVAEAAARLRDDGPNALPEAPGTPWWRRLAAQFASPLIGLLAVAAAVSGALGQRVEAAAIMAIVVVNGLVGFAQEFRADAAVRALLLGVAAGLVPVTVAELSKLARARLAAGRPVAARPTA